MLEIRWLDGVARVEVEVGTCLLWEGTRFSVLSRFA